MNPPDYTFDKIKFATDRPTLEKAIALYEAGKVIQVEEEIRSYTGIVIGTKSYKVFVEARRFDYGSCTCYLGLNGTLCKHMVALAIYAAKDGRPLTKEEKKIIQNPSCSGQLGNLDDKNLSLIKKLITEALRYVKPYIGSSRTWFTYQNSLSEGCNRLSVIITKLPVSVQTADLIVDLLLRLDKKLTTGGIDDSDGTVSGFIEEIVEVLRQFAKLDPNCIKLFDKLKNRDTSFGWENPLLNLYVS
ncbi:MAG: hypothetical protein KGL95_10120 [Patescibacteria group bacterium]|nr:hypothetical protein [Patescibacteria group bacterium]